jgi:hypothetical protein
VADASGHAASVPEAAVPGKAACLLQTVSVVYDASGV